MLTETKAEAKVSMGKAGRPRKNPEQDNTSCDINGERVPYIIERHPCKLCGKIYVDSRIGWCESCLVIVTEYKERMGHAKYRKTM